MAKKSLHRWSPLHGSHLGLNNFVRQSGKEVCDVMTSAWGNTQIICFQDSDNIKTLYVLKLNGH